MVGRRRNDNISGEELQYFVCTYQHIDTIVDDDEGY